MKLVGEAEPQPTSEVGAINHICVGCNDARHEEKYTEDGFGSLCTECCTLITMKALGNRKERRRKAAEKRRAK